MASKRNSGLRVGDCTEKPNDSSLAKEAVALDSLLTSSVISVRHLSLSTMGCRLKHGMFLADVAFAWIIVFPMGVFYWRGTWDIWTTYVNLDCRGENVTADHPGPSRLHIPGHCTAPDECVEIHGLWLSALVGALGCILINVCSPFLLEYATPKRMHMVLYVIISRFYCYIMAFMNLGFWRGVWSLVDHYGDGTWRTNLIGLGAALGLAFVCRVSIQAKSLPWEIGSEVKGPIYESATWLGKTVSVVPVSLWT